MRVLLLWNDSRTVWEKRGTLSICTTERQGEERKERRSRENPMLIIHPYVYYTEPEKIGETLPFPHSHTKPALYPSSLPPSLFLQGLLNERKWGRRLVKEGKQSNEGFMLNGGRKRKVPCHTHASGETEFTVHLHFYRVFLWSRVCLMKSECGIMGKCSCAVWVCW